MKRIVMLLAALALPFAACGCNNSGTGTTPLPTTTLPTDMTTSPAATAAD